MYGNEPTVFNLFSENSAEVPDIRRFNDWASRLMMNGINSGSYDFGLVKTYEGRDVRWTGENWTLVEYALPHKP